MPSATLKKRSEHDQQLLRALQLLQTAGGGGEPDLLIRQLLHCRILEGSHYLAPSVFLFTFFFNDPATTEIYTLSLHDALPISRRRRLGARQGQREADHRRHEGQGRCRQGRHRVGQDRRPRLYEQQFLQVTPAIELSGIHKSFGSVHAVRGVSLRIDKGAITGIVGENGAGKSTLMSILYGLYRTDAGEIRIDGRAVAMESPHDAIAQGIGMVHQHFMLVDTFTVLENLVLGAEGGPLLAGGLAAARAELARLAREYGLSVNPDARVADLSVGEQQRVEILKVLFRGARILILDEPSAVLTPQETDQLFRILATLKERGVSIVLITHKLREIMAATDHVYVMRQGQIVADRPTSETNPEELAELMVGRKVLLQLDKSASRPGEVLLRAEHLTLIDDRGVRLLDDVGLELRAGEIVGIAGVSGNGQSELLQILSGIRAPTSGRLTVCGRAIDASQPCDPAEMRNLRLAHVPEDRLRQGMVAAFQAAETAILGYQEKTPYC